MTTALTGAEYDAALATAGAAFAEYAGSLDPQTAVPSCPGWTMQQLVGHLGGVHAWAAAVVRGSGPKVPRPEPEGELSEWYLAQLGVLQQALAQTDQQQPVWTFNGTQPVSFWARRQAHELAMHLCDAQLAAGQQPTYSGALAADAVSEVFDVMTPRMSKDRPVPVSAPIAFVASDSGDRWLVRPSEKPGLVDYDHGGAGDAVVTATAPVQTLATGIWRRTPTSDWQIDGDRSVLETFIDTPLTP
ncbi:maleylpyruvate isomerase family mycothiol-dependent enzyme [Epidermidibacterium keratini]|uniref:Maleylpyruvate isomerase family mycothiol-dependent enzyme n=1 Tax=Epidermidibacterium keratini TaxID=1891644 RepID=A0A7L4YRH3_9ACTN|nr:maleylpyruvate isomerase family mycothiol-dependent enzyme [Epidermidibacterium keratini]QHC01746.1 maleylpyruvate isomerase family mycothiol-dependent enzyme [Epidermidibacterium keratini]